jgi:hypothetical protein
MLARYKVGLPFQYQRPSIRCCYFCRGQETSPIASNIAVGESSFVVEISSGVRTALWTLEPRVYPSYNETESRSASANYGVSESSTIDSKLRTRTKAIEAFSLVLC